VQFIDVRDLAEWTIRMVEAGRMGVYNATGPDRVLTMGEVLAACQQASGSDATLTWVDEAFLLAENIQPWSQMTLWLPESDENAGFNAIDISRALNAGLTFRSPLETASATLAWVRSLPAERERRAGLAAEDEARLLQKWYEQANS
jgi:2'-hydroxyisoflavone reductase